MPRNVLVNETLTPYYHCISRCVRRAYLCGRDPLTRKNFNHRKAWVVRRLRQLTGIFAIEVCAYAVMSNHLHLVLRLCSGRARRWSAAEVEQRWARLFPRSVQRAKRLPAAERERLLAQWRSRLGDLSWFMRCLNEHIARRANREDRCSGRFWEGRFRSQALMDPWALLTCLSYVDLNPVRSGLARSVRQARFTSVWTRLRYARRGWRCPWLVPFEEQGDGAGGAQSQEAGSGGMLPMLEATAAALRERRQKLLEPAGSTLRRMGLSDGGFVEAVRSFSRTFFTMVGEVHRIRVEAKRRGLKRCCGVAAAARLYASTAPAAGDRAVA